MSRIAIILIFASFLLADFKELPSKEQVKADFEQGNFENYMFDTFSKLESEKLLERGILTNQDDLVSNVSKAQFKDAVEGKTSIFRLLACPKVGEKFTASIYNFDAENGILRCAVAPVGDLYRPIGYFEVIYPGAKQFFSKDRDAALSAIASEINIADQRYTELHAEKKSIYSKVSNYSGNNFLNIPDLFLSTVLTDTDIIDLPASLSTNKLQLKSGYNSQIIQDDGSKVDFSKDYISARATTMSVIYSRLSDLSIMYLIFLVIFFGAWGIFTTFGRFAADKLEKQQNHDKKIPYLSGIIFGLIFFFPISDQVDGLTAGDQEQYSVYHTNFQHLERKGYYLFMNWSNDAAKIIIDAELDNIISRSGITSKENLINAQMGYVQAKNVADFSKNFLTECRGIYEEYNVAALSPISNKKFMPVERLAYASAWLKGGISFYNPIDQGGFVTAYPQGTQAMDGSYYPSALISACGKAEDATAAYTNKMANYKSELDSVAFQDTGKADQKLGMIKQLIKFQYELQRDYGPLAVLGLPITVMQTEARGILVKKDTQINDKLEKSITADSWGGVTHTITSTIPYLFIPGMFTVYESAYNAQKDIFKSGAGKIGGWLTGMLSGGMLGWVGNVAGTAVGEVFGSLTAVATSMWLVTNIASTLLALAPVVAIVLLGVVRFSIIVIKIFAFHFISVFIMPIMFARENWKGISAFFMKIFATMVELPIFVLSIWLAMTANHLIQAFGEPLSKRIILGMLEASAEQYSTLSLTENNLGLSQWLAKLKIYFYNGFMEIGIAVFATVVIYKIITSIHASLFDMLEVRAEQRLDNAVEDMQRQSANWGTKI